MGRKAFGEDRIMEAILKLADGKSVFEDMPMARLKNVTECCEATLKKYLDVLANQGFIRIDCADRRGGIGRIVILKSVLPVVARPAAIPKPATSPRAPKVSATALPSPPAPLPLPVPESANPLIVVLVDYDNVYSTILEANSSISFAKLKALVREHGRILFADVFLSPASTKPDVIAKLWDAGFQVIACPMENKDKDSVDAKILTRAVQYLERTHITKLVIVSRDRDFRGLTDQAADMGKDTVFIDVSKEIERLKGADILPMLFPKKETERFERTLSYLMNRQKDHRPGGKERMRILKDIIQIIRNLNPKCAFRPLVSDVSRELEIQNKAVSERDVRAALTAIVNVGILVKNESATRTFYIFNINHRTCNNI